MLGKKLTAIFVVVSAAVLVPTVARADGPQWTGFRTLDCGPDGIVETVLPPGGFGTAFHLVDGTGVILPKWVEVRFPGVSGFVTTLDRGSGNAAAATIECRYTDPRGLDVHFVGVRTPATP